MKKIIQQLKTFGFVFDTIDYKHGFACGANEYFVVRILQKEQYKPSNEELLYNKDTDYKNKKEWEIHFAFKKYFDRWANSRNFQCYANYSGRKVFSSFNKTHWGIPDWKKCFKLMKQLRPMFDWNSYFYTIDLPNDQIYS